MNKEQNAVSLWEVEPVSSILQKIHYQFVTKKMHSLSVVSEHRAEGKTTLSMLISRGLKEVYNLDVLLLDLNPQGDSLLSKYLGDYKSHDGMVLNHQFPFSVFRVKDLEVDWSKNLFDGPFFNRLVSNYSSQYDMVIVDSYTPTDASSSLLKVNTDSNLIVQSEGKSSSHKIQKELELDRKHLIGIVLNK